MGEAFHWLSYSIPKMGIAACYAAAAVYLMRKRGGGALVVLLLISLAIISIGIVVITPSRQLFEVTFFIAVLAILLLGPAALSVWTVWALYGYRKMPAWAVWTVAPVVGAAVAIGVTNWSNNLWI